MRRPKRHRSKRVTIKVLRGIVQSLRLQRKMWRLKAAHFVGLNAVLQDKNRQMGKAAVDLCDECNRLQKQLAEIEGR